MATKTWTDVNNANLEPGDPIRSVDIIALNDNDTASFEGAAGAPKLSLSAIEVLTAGTTIRSRKDAASTAPSASLVLHHGFSFMQRGTIRVTAQHVANGTGSTSTMYFRRTRNGTTTTINSWSTNSTSYVTRTVDISVLPGDFIGIYHAITFIQDVGDTSGCANGRFQTNGENLWPGSTARLENTFEAL